MKADRELGLRARDLSEEDARRRGGTDVTIPLERPRNKRDDGFDQLVDSIFERIV